MEDDNSRKRRKISKYDHSSTNGLILQTKYIPEEILIKILCNVDHITLLSCQLVCKCWQNLIQRFIWLKKTEETIKQKLLVNNKDISWMAYYFICAKVPFNKNLLKNHSGKEYTYLHWEKPTVRNITWYRERPAVPELPDDPLFNVSENNCFITSADITWKYQIIDLNKEGFSQFLLDTYQPKIMISEWYCCQETPGLYLCDIEFLNDDGEKMLMVNEDTECNYQDHYTYTEIIRYTKQNQWLKFEHTFKNYGKGLRKINFIHGGKSHKNVDQEDTRRHYGVKMTRACIRIDLPLNNYAIKST